MVDHRRMRSRLCGPDEFSLLREIVSVVCLHHVESELLLEQFCGERKERRCELPGPGELEPQGRAGRGGNTSARQCRQPGLAIYILYCTSSIIAITSSLMADEVRRHCSRMRAKVGGSNRNYPPPALSIRTSSIVLTKVTAAPSSNAFAFDQTQYQIAASSNTIVVAIPGYP